MKEKFIDVIIPAYNEAGALPLVIDAIPKHLVRHIIVANNGSTDNTGSVANAAGAIVVDEPRSGYGHACLAAMAFLEKLPPNDQPFLVVFLDGDFSDYPEEMPLIVGPILNGTQDFVIGSRRLGGMESGAMTLPQQFGNWLAPALIRLFWSYRFSDLGPFRAIRWQHLLAMQMEDKTFGWTVEMQVKAAKMKLRAVEVPVKYRKRAAGKSKVSGTIRGTFLAGWKILYTIFKLL